MLIPMVERSGDTASAAAMAAACRKIKDKVSDTCDNFVVCVSCRLSHGVDNYTAVTKQL